MRDIEGAILPIGCANRRAHAGNAMSGSPMVPLWVRDLIARNAEADVRNGLLVYSLQNAALQRSFGYQTQEQLDAALNQARTASGASPMLGTLSGGLTTGWSFLGL